MRRARGIEATAADIVVTGGSMQAIALLAAVTVQPGDPVVAETPGYRGIRRAVAAAGGILNAVAVDDRGIVPDDWPARLLFVTPSRQFPTGAVLPLERRRALLDWASRRDALIVEDDYDSEFRHRGRPIEPLKALDRDGRVVYIGTFSKTMPEGVRIGYAVLPGALRDVFLKAKQLYEPHPTGSLEQRALAAFLASGLYERHLRRMKRLYAARFERLSALFQQRLSHLFKAAPADAGLHLYARWQGTSREWNAYRDACRQVGVKWSDTAEADLAGCFGFSQLTEAELEEGVSRLEQAWRKVGGD